MQLSGDTSYLASGYRPEVDGLRALAVALVVAFHAGSQWLPGGYGGVDVFFVISGYLIASIILREKAEGRFTYANFYNRRIRRIIPALLLMVTVSVPLAWITMMPQDLAAYGRSLPWPLLFAANIYFWRNTDYFAEAAELQPLLHTWSLGVEEQFYIFAPFILLIALRWLGMKWLGWLILLGIVLSLALALMLVGPSPFASFYLLPTRAWELLIGIWIAVRGGTLRMRVTHSGLRGALSMTGLVLILGAGVIASGKTSFPDLNAYLSTIGAALVLLFADRGTWTHAVLAWRPMVLLGLVSYSFYLWHYPMFVFWWQWTAGTPESEWMFIPILAALLLAAVSWRVVEQPCRDAAKVAIKPLLASIIAISAIPIAASFYLQTDHAEQAWFATRTDETRPILKLVIEATKGRAVHAENEFAPDDNGDCRFRVERSAPLPSERLKACYAKYGPGHAIAGDSHAADLFDLVVIGDMRPFIFGNTRPGCRVHSDAPCRYDEFASFIRNNPKVFAGIVYEESEWTIIELPSGDKTMEDVRLDEPVNAATIKTTPITQSADYLGYLAKEVPTVWLGPRPAPYVMPYDYRRQGCTGAYTLRPGQTELYAKVDRAIAKASAERPGLRHVSQAGLYQYDYPADLLDCGTLYWEDSNHLSPAGKKRFGERLNLLDTLFPTAVAANTE